MDTAPIIFGTIAGAVAGSAATALRDRYESLLPVREHTGIRPISPRVSADSPGVHRASEQLSFWTGRSICRSCKHTLRWFELVPIVSYLAQRGRCRRCHEPIGWGSFAIEVSAAIVGAAAAWYIASPVVLALVWVSLVITGAIVLADIEEQLIPDVLVLGLAPVSLVIGLLRFSQSPTLGVVGGLTASLLLLLLWFVTKKRGIGLGDAKLMAALGIGFGWMSLFVAWVAFTVGGAAAIVLLLAGRAEFKQRIAFGPFLVAAYYLTILIGPRVAAWYSWY